MKSDWKRLTDAPGKVKLAVGVLGALLVLVVLASTISSNSELKDDLAASESRELALEADLDQTQEQLSDTESELASAEQAAKTALKQARGEVRDELAAGKAQLDRRARGLNDREAGLDQRAAAVSQEEQREKLRIIREDGIWETDVDFTGGTYRSTGGGGCYWAKLSDPSGEFGAIIANGNGANQTVTIDSPWFETSRCGTWEPVG